MSLITAPIPRAKETTTTTGTGALTLAGSVAQFQTLNAAIGTNNSYAYMLVDANGTGWEYGIGTSTAADGWSRDTIIKSTNSDAAISLSAGTHTIFLLFNPGNFARIANLAYIIGDGTATITTGLKYGFRVPFDCVINSVTLGADATGSIVIDIWKDTQANFPPTVADTITASAKPTLASAQKSEDTTLTGWTTAVTAGDWLYFNVDSAATVKMVSLNLKVTKT